MAKNILSFSGAVPFTRATSQSSVDTRLISLDQVGGRVVEVLGMGEIWPLKLETEAIAKGKC